MNLDLAEAYGVQQSLAFLRWIVLALYLGTPIYIVYRWVKLSRAGRGKPALPMLGALALWLLQLATLIYAIARCAGGHCRLTTFQEYAPAVVSIAAYAGIGVLLWIVGTRPRDRAQNGGDGSARPS